MAVLAAAIAFAGFVFMPEAKKTEQGADPS
jgi:hypothetical protein